MINNETYVSEEMKEVARIFYKHGLKIGESLKDSFKSGHLDPSKPITVLVPVADLDITRFSLLTRVTMAMGTEKAGVAGNCAIVSMGVYTGGNSAIQYGITTNRKAKTLYALSTFFSASAIASGGLAAASRTCNISPAGCMSESLAFAFMKLGNKVHVIALQLEGKPIPRKMQKYMDPGIRPLSFIKPQDINVIGAHQIFVVISVVFTIYAYRKILVKCYQYGHQFISKRKKLHDSKIFRKQVTFIIHCLNNRQSVVRAKKTYRLVIG
jgi:hypothetical protein